jgi:peptidyl-prolyl cis-trans isomerase A (cyclophilin A)
MTSVVGFFLLGPTLTVEQNISAQISAGDVTIVMETEAGAIELLIDSARAPVTAANFLRYVNAGLLNGGSFYRTVRVDNQPNDSVKISVIQGGMDRTRRDDAFDPIRLEGTRETNINHVDGTLSMARAGPHTARAEFFVCIGDQPELDSGGRRNSDGLGFAAFGRVTRGMDVVRRIHAMATDGQRLQVPVRIRRVTRLSRR